MVHQGPANFLLPREGGKVGENVTKNGPEDVAWKRGQDNTQHACIRKAKHPESDIFSTTGFGLSVPL